MNKIFSFFSKLWKSNKKIFTVVLVFLFICVILAYLSGSRLVENFDFGSLASSVPGSTSSIPTEYENLAPIPPGTVWSDETQNAFVDKYNITNHLTGDQMLTKEKLSTVPYFSFTNWMTMASEKEAKYYVDNGILPWDDYVTNFMKNDPDISKSPALLDLLPKAWPNRVAYKIFVTPKTVPLPQFLSKVWVPNYNEAENNQFWKCEGGILTTKNGSDGQESATTDYSFFEKNIKDFQFTNGTCNPCAIPSTKIEGGLNTPIDFYNSPNNQCKFTVGTNPEAYNIFTGGKGLASTAAPANESSAPANYQECVSQCDKYKS